MVDLVFESEQQQEVGVTLLMTGADSAFCLVAMPKTQFGDELRRQLEQDIVGQLNASYCDHGIFVGRYDTVLLHYYLTGVDRPDDARIRDLTEYIRSLATPWLAGLWAALADSEGERQADRLADTYGRAFPTSWTRRTQASRAVRDILNLEALSGNANVLADLFQDEDGIVLRLYEADDVVLSDILPVLDNFGLVVHSSYATEVNSRGGTLHMDTFRISDAVGCDFESLIERADQLTASLKASFDHQVTDDPLNGLVLRAGLTWQQVDVLRGYSNYAKQLGINVGDARVRNILLNNPVTCRRLVELFSARFDPDLKRSRARATKAAEDTVREELRLIQSHDEHLIVSAMLNLMLSTVRTNAYRTDRSSHYLSFKLDCSKVRAMGPGRPTYEIYVHNVDLEGVHLRFGMTARGGLRWSDRNDYRTEVLGLATTQLVKNTVIVPTGAKGGFFLKNASTDRGVLRQQADDRYKIFIRGLLDLTDNNVEGEIVSPPRVVCHDGPDAYLVVAADKGTAHLSDTANAISMEYGHWLGDAFASGGSNGYDHKGVGVTAKGAWKLVRRHFGERGVNPSTDLFTAVGIGDMGGDVFGNGLLETDKVQLKAAFNHMHIFLDPSPKAATSFAERQRLFGCQGGWDQYNTKLISKGGGVFNRRHKSVPLSTQAQKMLGINADEASPEVVMHHILKMDVDLLWNGGIGTYVKASTESHADADDRSNNALRVDAIDLRCRIIGEGGNLGLTQRGRIEASLHGVALNTDAIDNSGGVDMSDHEVNLKILLQQVVDRGELTDEERNKVLAEMTDEVADLVYANNDAHGRQLSRDVLRSKRDIWQFARAIAFVEREFERDRTLLFLPNNEELARRAELGLGLTRPELAVLSAWVKMWVFKELMRANPKDLPGYDLFLTSYFPKHVQATWPEDITRHMLADEIAMTCATTRLVADAGAAFVPGVVESTGAPMLEVASAFLKAQFLARTHLVRSELEDLRSTVPLSALYNAWIRVDDGARGVARYWLSTRGRLPTDIELKEMAGATSKVYELQASEVASRNKDIVQELSTAGITEGVAQRVLKSQYLNDALMIWSEARETKTAFADMVVKHLAVARASRLQQVMDDLSDRPSEGRWDPIAMRILYSRFHALLRTAVVNTPMAKRKTSVDTLEPKLARGALKEVRGQVDRILGGFDDDNPPSAATLLVLEERLVGAIRRLRA
jgi:glutamate dehydrogenase